MALAELHQKDVESNNTRRKRINGQGMGIKKYYQDQTQITIRINNKYQDQTQFGRKEGRREGR